MPSDTTFPEATGSVLWYFGEIAFKWVPGFIVSLAGAQAPSDTTILPPHPPTITEPVTVLDIVHFIRDSAAPGVYPELYNNWYMLVSVSIMVSLIFAAIMIYCLIRLFQIRQHEYQHFQHMAHPVHHHDVPKAKLRWDRIREQAHSDSDQSRRMAVLEADIMLAELLDELGYRGETLADKLRQVQKAQFNTVDYAWEAHRTRNRIAHESGHELTPHEAARVISMYDKVFREFGFVQDANAAESDHTGQDNHPDHPTLPGQSGH